MSRFISQFDRPRNSLGCIFRMHDRARYYYGPVRFSFALSLPLVAPLKTNKVAIDRVHCYVSSLPPISTNSPGYPAVIIEFRTMVERPPRSRTNSSLSYFSRIFPLLLVRDKYCLGNKVIADFIIRWQRQNPQSLSCQPIVLVCVYNTFFFNRNFTRYPSNLTRYFNTLPTASDSTAYARPTGISAADSPWRWLCFGLDSPTPFFSSIANSKFFKLV